MLQNIGIFNKESCNFDLSVQGLFQHKLFLHESHRIKIPRGIALKNFYKKQSLVQLKRIHYLFVCIYVFNARELHRWNIRVRHVFFSKFLSNTSRDFNSVIQSFDYNLTSMTRKITII